VVKLFDKRLFDILEIEINCDAHMKVSKTNDGSISFYCGISCQRSH
jgi:hypothetical protein